MISFCSTCSRKVSIVIVLKADFYGMTSAFYLLLLQTAAYKGTGKRTYAERARELGLGPAATEVLQGTENKYVSAV